MPAQAPVIGEAVVAKLGVIGQRIREHRKALRVSAMMAAESAGMSRVTLHRIERGEASVTMGAYLNVMAALGLGIELVVPRQSSAGQDTGERRPEPERQDAILPPSICLADYPQLKRLAWHIPGATEVTPVEALGLYERNWRHVDKDRMDARELDLVNKLVKILGKGHMLV